MYEVTKHATDGKGNSGQFEGHAFNDVSLANDFYHYWVSTSPTFYEIRFVVWDDGKAVVNHASFGKLARPFMY